MKKVIFLIICILFISGCENSNNYNNNQVNNEASPCSMGEVQINGRCCRYISRYPNKDGSCPVGYDDSAPSGYNQNMCWKEKCN